MWKSPRKPFWQCCELGRIEIDGTSASRDWKRIIPGLIISLASLIAVLVIIDIERFIQALRLADYRLVVLVFGLTLCWLLVRGVVWRTLLQGKASLPQTFWTVNQGYLLNNLLPFRLGEISRAFLLGKKAGLEFWQVFSTILIERALDVAFAAALLLAAMPSAFGTKWARQAAVGAGGFILLVLLALYLLAHFRQQAMKIFERLTARWNRLEKIGSRHLNAFLSGLAVLDDFKQFLKAVTWMALNWGIAVLQFYALVLAFFPTGKLVWAIFALGVLALGIAAPSSPGAIGVQELAMVAALAAFKLDASVALAAALTAHLTNYLVTGILGSYALFKDGETLSSLYRRVRHISIEPPSSNITD